jgi:8-amino-7-oxononanoate synthase
VRRFSEHIAHRLHHLRDRGLLREPVVSAVPAGTHAVLQGRRVLNLCSNNYLGLADDPRVLSAVSQAAARWGGAAASRLVSGTLQPHRDAERCLASFLGHEDARLFSSGYAANVGALAALVGPDDVVFSDALNHASLIDGCRLSRARVHVFPHRDLDALASLLHAHRAEGDAALVVSDAVFSMDGDVADLAGLRRLADTYDAGLFVDEAHSLGILGPEGRGLAASANVRADVTTGMLGKAFGLSGGLVAGDAPLLRLLESTARSYVFSTGVHAALAAAVPPVTELVRASDPARAHLVAHRRTLADALDGLPGVPPGLDPAVPILPILVGDGPRALALADRLLARGLFVRGIRPPTVPLGTARLRLVPMATHRPEDIREAASVLREELARAPGPVVRP